MKRKKQKHKKKVASADAASVPVSAKKDKPPMTRRRALNLAINAGLGLAAVGGGWYVFSEVRAGIVEGDLSRIGQGVPMVVQIHDPQCQQCIALQRETRAALEGFSEDELQYVVANIRQPSGRKLASLHGVPHVTLLLFDANGTMREAIQGVSDRAYLSTAFQRHLARRPAT
ncbi:MAG: hypothetical protein AAGC81_18900 [Pseudomonadota bacterium]